MSDPRDKYTTVSLPNEVVTYLNWAKTQVPNAQEISASSIVQIICRWAISNPDYLTMCIASAANDPNTRRGKRKRVEY